MSRRAGLRVARALLLERLTPYPRQLYQRIGHPVVWIGAALEALERRWNRPQRSGALKRASGVAAVLLTAGASAGLAWLAERISAGGRAGAAAWLLLAHPGLAQRSLREHVEAVRAPLLAGELKAARRAVAAIVGRDTIGLDIEGVAAAALESLAESFNDAVVAPAFWLAVAGLPGLWVYKAVNTADSLIGHKEPRWRDFGWAAARLDDALNLIPARLAGGLLALAGGGGWRVMWRDAPAHASPNAGWPEAAMAGALKVRLGGPARYDGVQTRRPWFGDGPAPGADDVTRGLKVYGRACTLLLVAVGAVELLRAQRRR